MFSCVTMQLKVVIRDLYGGGALGYSSQSPSLPTPPKFYVHTYYASPMCTREHGKVISPGVDMYIHNVNIYSTEDLATHAKFTICHDYMFTVYICVIKKIFN